MRAARHLLYLLLAWIGAMALPSSAAAMPGAVGRMLPVCVARALPGDAVDPQWGRAGGYDCTSAQVSHGAGDFWVRAAQLPPRAGLVPLRLRSMS